MQPSSPLLRALLIAAVSGSLLQGCVVAAIGVGAGAAGYSMGQERGPKGVVSDTVIKGNINASWAKDKYAFFSYVDLNVFQGRVLLTGYVPDPAMRTAAEADVRGVGGVREVIDDIQVEPKTTAGTDAGDNWILTRLRSVLTFDGAVNSLNYSLQCVDKTVYILGIARDQAELDRVVNDARDIPNVRQVVTYIRIRSGSTAPNQDSAPSTAPVQTSAPPPDADDSGSLEIAPPNYGAAAPGVGGAQAIPDQGAASPGFNPAPPSAADQAPPAPPYQNQPAQAQPPRDPTDPYPSSPGQDQTTPGAPTSIEPAPGAVQSQPLQ